MNIEKAGKPVDLLSNTFIKVLTFGKLLLQLAVVNKMHLKIGSTTLHLNIMFCSVTLQCIVICLNYLVMFDNL